jgi:uncharacterized delta-60 repeat protein
MCNRQSVEAFSVWIIFLLAMSAGQVFGQAGAVDGTFNPGSGVNGAVYAVAVQADGKLVIGGEFTAFNGIPRSNLARLNADGSLDTTFAPGSIAGEVEALVVQSDGKVVIGGDFSSVGGVSRRNLARLNPDGSLDTGFVADADNTVYALALRSDGKLLVAGDFIALAGQRRERIAQLEPNGTLDTGFNPNAAANGTIFALALQPNGRILVGGAFTQVNGSPRSRLARLTPDGGLDMTFSQSGPMDGTVLALGVQPDGRIVVGGAFRFVSGIERNGIARLEPGGALDTSFGALGGVGGRLLPTVHAVGLQPNGRIHVAATSQPSMERRATLSPGSTGWMVRWTPALTLAAGPAAPFWRWRCRPMAGSSWAGRLQPSMARPGPVSSVCLAMTPGALHRCCQR